MEINELKSAIDSLEQGEYELAKSLFSQFSGPEWLGEPYEWKQDNALRMSGFIQNIVKILPQDTPSIKVEYLVENYLLALVDLPGSIDLAATALVNFWNSHKSMDIDSLINFLKLLSEHPDGENVPSIASQAEGLDFSFGGEAIKGLWGVKRES